MKRIVVIGAGIGGLSAAALLAAHGFDVTIVEKAAAPGGKMRTVTPGARPIDAGPTVFTMRWVFDELFATCGAALDDFVTLERADILARHAWPDGSRLDLFADLDRSADAVAAFAGNREAEGLRSFSAEAKAIFETLDAPFMRATRPSPLGLSWRIGLAQLPALFSIRPWTTLWQALDDHFQDQRLRQLFGRYATYSGASPFAAPATLMLIAEAERRGVWLVEGGMHRLACALEALAIGHGAVFRYACEVGAVARNHVTLASGEELSADHIVSNADPGAFGATAPTKARDRSLSALTWAIDGATSGFPLVRHNVFFSADYAREFAELGAGRLPRDPTIYVCAQDRGDAAAALASDRLLLIVNAPANGDTGGPGAGEIEACAARVMKSLSRAGLSLKPGAMAITGPAEFEALFPGSGGALYGRVPHGSMGAFRRPGSSSRQPNLWLAGGATHPGAGVPMAALSGWRAADAIIRAST